MRAPESSTPASKERDVAAALDALERSGVLLGSAKGPVPNLADTIAGETIRGSWWAHARGHAIFGALTALADHPDVKCFKLVQTGAGKRKQARVTFVHRRVWPALVKLAEEIGHERLGEVREEHTPSGAHETKVTPYPTWVTDDVHEAAAGMSDTEARAALGAVIAG